MPRLARVVVETDGRLVRVTSPDGTLIGNAIQLMNNPRMNWDGSSGPPQIVTKYRNIDTNSWRRCIVSAWRFGPMGQAHAIARNTGNRNYSPISGLVSRER